MPFLIINGEHMDNEIQILKIINEEITQRDIANKTGMSLGSINILIKKLIKKGLIKVERINKKNLKYILTPEGALEKAKATYKYIVDSFNYIYELNLKIDHVIERITNDGYEGIILFKRNDEIEKILTEKLNKNSIKFVKVNSEKDKADLDKFKNYIAVVWHPDDLKDMLNKNVPIINLID